MPFQENIRSHSNCKEKAKLWSLRKAFAALSRTSPPRAKRRNQLGSPGCRNVPGSEVPCQPMKHLTCATSISTETSAEPAKHIREVREHFKRGGCANGYEFVDSSNYRRNE